MKKSILSMLAVAGIGVVLFSCKPEEPVAPAEPGSAKVSGVLEANLETYNDTDQNGNPAIQWEKVPSGTMIRFTYDSGDLDADKDPLYDYEDETVTTEVGSNGTYEVEVPAISTPMTVTVSFDDFAHEREDSLASGGTNRVTFSKADEIISVQDEATLIRDYVY